LSGEDFLVRTEPKPRNGKSKKISGGQVFKGGSPTESRGENVERKKPAKKKGFCGI